MRAKVSAEEASLPAVVLGTFLYAMEWVEYDSDRWGSVEAVVADCIRYWTEDGATTSDERRIIGMYDVIYGYPLGRITDWYIARSHSAIGFATSAIIKFRRVM